MKTWFFSILVGAISITLIPSEPTSRLIAGATARTFMASSLAISAGAAIASQFYTRTAAPAFVPHIPTHGSFLSVVDLLLSMYTKRKEHANMPLDLLDL